MNRTNEPAGLDGTTLGPFHRRGLALTTMRWPLALLTLNYDSNLKLLLFFRKVEPVLKLHSMNMNHISAVEQIFLARNR